ncbi:MAG: type 1 glutamine amidotransferase [Burkholderiales bacterium]
MLKIGLSACFFHPDPNRNIFKGKTLQYLEQSIARWVMSSGAMLFMIPSPEQNSQIKLTDYARELDGLVLQGGSDLSPASYGETAMKPEWSGDKIRDEYEIELTQSFMAKKKPVLGICRGVQLINVAMGGSLFQDIKTQRPEAQSHRDAVLYDQTFHEVEFVPNSGLAKLYPGITSGKINTVHHQAPKDIGTGLIVEAWSTPDRIPEALRWSGDSYVFGVQWHPEFQDPARTDLLDTKPILNEFLSAARTTPSV